MYSIGIVGNGFVGSSVASGFSLHAKVKIYDVDSRKSTHTFKETLDSDYIFVAVPTPMKKIEGGSSDLFILDSTLKKISQVNKRKDNVVVIKSTIIPGTTEKYVEKYKNLNIVHSPEFLTERVARLDFINSARIVLGGEPENTEKVKDLFRIRFPHTKIIQTDAVTAEFIKYMANCFFAVKVSFMNELKQASERLNVNCQDAMNGFTSDGRIGNSHLDVPGHDGQRGFGRKCFPKDLNAFIHFFNSIDVRPTVMSAAWEKNLEVRRNYDWKDIDGAVSEKE